MMTFVILLYLFDLGMILSENRYPLFRIMPWRLARTGLAWQTTARNRHPKQDPWGS
jgi:hypothetical protein